jgi:hypothetical protein
MFGRPKKIFRAQPISKKNPTDRFKERKVYHKSTSETILSNTQNKGGEYLPKNSKNNANQN